MEYGIKDFKQYLEDCNITKITESVVNDYCTCKFYDIETDEDIEELNDLEDYIRKNYLNKNLEDIKE